MNEPDPNGPVARVLGRLQGVRRTKHGWIARCPAHDDHDPSLSISNGDDGRILLYCHRGCSIDAIVAALRFQMSDLFPAADRRSDASPKRSSRTASRGPGCANVADVAAKLLRDLGIGWTHAATYLYGRAAAALRFEREPAEKTFRPVHQADGLWFVGDPPGKWSLYRLTEIADAPRVCVVEGEKCADAAATIGFAATTSAHGAKSPDKTDWTPLAGRDVMILPDNDAPGRQYADQVASVLAGLNPPATVRIVVLPDVPEHGDIVEFMALRRAAGRSDAEIVSEVDAMALATAPHVSSVGASVGGSACFSGDPEDLPNELQPVAPFDLGLLPNTFRPWIADISERMQCPPDYPAVAAMVSFAAVVGRRIGIRPKRHDDWLVVPNLWGAAVGRPGVLKSPAIQESLRPIHGLERNAREQHRRNAKRREAEKLVDHARRKECEKEVRVAIREDKDALELALGLVDKDAEEPTRVRFIVNDSTVEKLGELLNENKNGVLCFRDELVGLLRSLDKEGQEGARAFYLEAWNGCSPYTYDRIGRGTIDIESTTLSLLGSIQPGRLLSYLNGAMDMGSQDDGLVQRLQLLVWPDVSKDWKHVDRAPDLETRQSVEALFRDMVARTGVELGGELDENDRTAIPFTRFAEDAQEKFIEWFGSLERRVRTAEEHPAFESHLAKYRSLVPSLALLIHLAEERGGRVGLPALEKALGWVRYLETHAGRVYAVVERPELQAAKRLAVHILNGDVDDNFDARSVYRHGWSGLNSPEQVAAALRVLEAHRWTRKVVTKSSSGEGGAPAATWVIHPMILERAHKGTDKTDATGSEQERTREERPKATDMTDRTPVEGPSGSSVSSDLWGDEDSGGDAEAFEV